jgi:hypothetical protein
MAPLAHLGNERGDLGQDVHTAVDLGFMKAWLLFET